MLFKTQIITFVHTVFVLESSPFETIFQKNKLNPAQKAQSFRLVSSLGRDGYDFNDIDTISDSAYRFDTLSILLSILTGQERSINGFV